MSFNNAMKPSIDMPCSGNSDKRDTYCTLIYVFFSLKKFPFHFPGRSRKRARLGLAKKGRVGRQKYEKKGEGLGRKTFIFCPSPYFFELVRILIRSLRVLLEMNAFYAAAVFQVRFFSCRLTIVHCRLKYVYPNLVRACLHKRSPFYFFHFFVTLVSARDFSFRCSRCPSSVSLSFLN